MHAIPADDVSDLARKPAKPAWTMILMFSIAAYGIAITRISTYKAAITEMNLQNYLCSKAFEEGLACQRLDFSCDFKLL